MLEAPSLLPPAGAHSLSQHQHPTDKSKTRLSWYQGGNSWAVCLWPQASEGQEKPWTASRAAAGKGTATELRDLELRVASWAETLGCRGCQGARSQGWRWTGRGQLGWAWCPRKPVWTFPGKLGRPPREGGSWSAPHRCGSHSPSCLLRVPVPSLLRLPRSLSRCPVLTAWGCPRLLQTSLLSLCVPLWSGQGPQKLSVGAGCRACWGQPTATTLQQVPGQGRGARGCWTPVKGVGD